MRHKDANRSPNGDTQPPYTGQERRTSPRIQTPFPAAVRSVEVDDQPFDIGEVNVSVNGISDAKRVERGHVSILGGGR